VGNEQKIINITAYADTDKKKPAIVKGLAYNGGILELGLPYSVCVDLYGMEIPESIPLLTDHRNEIGSKIGEIKAKVVDNALYIEGKITSDSYLANNIVSQSKNGGKWSLSIGALLTEFYILDEGKVINGQDIPAGVCHATKSLLREVSVVAVGADKDATLEIEAKAKQTNTLSGGENMGDEIKKTEEEIKKDVEEIQAEEKDEKEFVDVPAVLRIERDRIKAIKEIVEDDTELEETAITAGWSADKTAREMLKRIKASRPNINVNTNKTEASQTKTIEAALMLRAGINEDEVIKAVGEQAIEAGYKARSISIKDAARACIKASGQSVGLGFGNSEIKAAFNSALPGILSNVANKRLQQAFAAYNPVATKLAQTVDINDFKQSDILSIADFSNLSEVVNTGANAGKLTADKLVEGKGTNQLKTYGKIISLTRQDIINDDLGAFLRITDILGNRCARTIDQLFFAKLLANGAWTDGNKLFSTAHKNLLDITTNALSVNSVKTAIADFLKQVGLDGEPVGVMPKYLVVPPELYFLGKEIADSTYMIGGNTKSAALNPVAGLLEVVQSPYLSNATYTGASATDWYLFGSPDELPAMEIGFLKGQTAPTIEGSDCEFDTLGYSWRVYYDIGVGVADYRGALKVGTIPAEGSSGTP